MGKRDAASIPFGSAQRAVALRGPWRALAPGPSECTSAPLPAQLAARAAAALPRRPSRPVLVVPDRTRYAALERLLPPLVEALGGGRPRCLFASGTHRPMSEEEMSAALGKAAALVEPVAHDGDRSPTAPAGPLPDGGRARLHAALFEADAILVVGALAWHYLAGFGGGRKMLLPGLADRASATAVHRLSLTDDPPGRRPGVGPGLLDENPMHRAIVDALEGLPPIAAISVVTAPDTRAILDAEAGELLEHHRALAARFAARRTARARPSTRILVSAGGAPYDTDLVQAHKALAAAAPLAAPGARVVLAAACPSGVGSPALKTALARPAGDILDELLAAFTIGGQTAWSLRSLFERHDVGLLSTLPSDEVRTFGAHPLEDEAQVAAFLDGGDTLVCPAGAALWYLAEP